jgi:N-acetylmuramoyl-L-alanine amidase
MKKHLLLSGLVFLVLTAFTPLAQAIDTDADTSPAVAAVVIDGQTAELHVPLFVQDSATYVSLREFSLAMGADNVTWMSGTVAVAAPGLTATVTVGDMYLVANGRYLFIPDTCQLVNGSVMVPVRVLCKAFDASVAWDGETKTILVTKGSGAIAPGSDFYEKTDLYWMSRIIYAEAGCESFTGKIAVGGVIMNRLKSPDFPKTVYDIIFDRRFGTIQFTPVSSGTIYNTPTEECIKAAKIALDGGNTAGDSLYFAATTNCWAGRNRPLSMAIGHHYFYA